MKHRKVILSLLAIALLSGPLIVKAQQAEGGEQRVASPVIAVAPSRSLPDLLPEALAGLKATSDIRQYDKDNLTEIVANQAAAYQEYYVTQAVSRSYGDLRIDIFETRNQFTAFGLFSYNSGASRTRSPSQVIGSGSAGASGALVFWKDNCFARVSSANQRNESILLAARAVADSIAARSPAVMRPRLLESLPAESMIARSERYFLGPESLNAHVERGRDTFGFAGDAEAVMAEYRKSGSSIGRNAPLKLVIVEYHTPQFATDAMAAVTSYIESLSEQERSRLIIKREGNFIVEAANVEDREFAESLVGAVKYPYVVKWLSPAPRMPKEDPLHAQKAAQLLISVFSLLGLLLMGVLVAGSTFGAVIFFKRRKQQRQIFSDAGGMLRLELDPFETVILGLPPKREE